MDASSSRPAVILAHLESLDKPVAIDVAVSKFDISIIFYSHS